MFEIEIFTTLNSKEMATLTPITAERYHIELSTTVNVKEKNSKENTKNGTLTSHEKVYCTTPIAVHMAQKIPIGDALTTRKTFKGGNGHQDPCGELYNLLRDDNSNMIS